MSTLSVESPSNTTSEIPTGLLQLRSKLAKVGECIGGAAGEAIQNLAVVEAAQLARRGLQHFLAKGDLAVRFCPWGRREPSSNGLLFSRGVPVSPPVA